MDPPEEILTDSRQLEMNQARFNVIRRQALEAALTDLEPRRRGRPPKTDDPKSEEIDSLKKRVSEFEQELKLAEIRTELAHVLPQLGLAAEPAKKTTPERSARKSRSKKHRRRRHRKAK